MAGLPWVVVFGALAWFGMRRGWGWLVVLSVFCMGVAGADTQPGALIYGGAQGLVAGAWHGLLGLLNSAAS